MRNNLGVQDNFIDKGFNKSWGRMLIHAVILAGGTGTRFWPLSRETSPKQMLHIVGEDTLLRQTIKRLNGSIPLDHIWIVTTDALVQDIRFHLTNLGSEANRIRFIIEPSSRNTGPAVGLAAWTLNQLSSDSVMVVMPSDHFIRDTEIFQKKLQLTIEAAERGYLVTFGIIPTRPETAYGYIKSGEPLTDFNNEIFHGAGFFEKPDLKTAGTFFRQGGYFWNSGIFVWKTSKILSEIEKYLPGLYKTLKEIEGILFQSDQAHKRSALCSMRYASLENISIDHGVMEKSQDVLVIPSDFGWCDLGNWTALGDVLERDEQGNILQGNVVDVGSQHSTVIACDRVLATIGLKEMVVIDTPDATLVSSKESVHEVRKVVETLKRNHREEHLIHRTVEKPWGSYTVLEKGAGYKIKKISLNPGAKLSLQLHRKRSEHWVVLSGVARVTTEDRTYVVQANQSTYIPINTKHRLENLEKIPLHIVEVQNGYYVEEDDIERFDDEYGRA